MIPRVDVAGRTPREPASAGTRSGGDTAGEARPDVAPEPELALEVPQEQAATVIEQPAPEAPARGGVGGEAWDPVPVPLPTYVTKPEAPRREPKPLSGATPVAASAAAASDAQRTEVRAGPVADELLAAEPPRPRTETLGLPLEQILARRRAAG
jgi:hypothetical protein